MAEAAALTASFPVGRWTAEFTIQRPASGSVTHTSVEWAPDVPHRLTAAELAQYRAGRDRAFGQLAEQLGIRIAVVDL